MRDSWLRILTCLAVTHDAIRHKYFSHKSEDRKQTKQIHIQRTFQTHIYKTGRAQNHRIHWIPNHLYFKCHLTTPLLKLLFTAGSLLKAVSYAYFLIDDPKHQADACVSNLLSSTLSQQVLTILRSQPVQHITFVYWHFSDYTK